MQQARFIGGIEPMHKGQALEKQQTFHALEGRRRGGTGQQKTVGVPGEAADQQGRVVHQFRYGAQTQGLAIARGFIGYRDAADQRAIVQAQQVQRRQPGSAR